MKALSTRDRSNDRRPIDKFPGFEACLTMMRKSNGGIQEEGFGWLAEHATDHLPELVTEFEREHACGGELRFWLLELIGKARSLDAFDLLVRCLNDAEYEDVRHWAIFGLKELDTKEARRVLWEAGEKISR